MGRGITIKKWRVQDTTLAKELPTFFKSKNLN